jgi:putative endonuclease
MSSTRSWQRDTPHAPSGLAISNATTGAISNAVSLCHFDRQFILSFRAQREILMPQDRTYYVYLLTNWNNKVMYVGMTNDLKRRIYEHKAKTVKGFTEKYNLNKLVYFEATSNVQAAIAREKEIKKWRREKKNALVTGANPGWKDLSEKF